jgi:hypothetical protein
MAAGLYMDVHLPKAVSNQLRRRGVDVLTAHEDRTQLLDDMSLLERASEMGRVLVTQDIRFGALAESWQAAGRHFGGLVFAHQLEVTIGQLVQDLELIALASLPGECENQIYRLPL